MGSLLPFYCPFCHYHEPEIAVGAGKKVSQRLALFKCAHRKTVGSTRVAGETKPRCSNCYDTDITVFADDARLYACPRCGEQASFNEKEGGWS